MRNSLIATNLSLLCAMFVGAAALALFSVADASARVGVTSATDGDPLGKPPSEAERVLRVGIDVQANELITTKDNDRAHLLFLDGTALTVGPNSQLTIDKFVYDPDTKKGELAITASKGVFRLVGGKISKTAQVNINTPAASIGIRGGIVIVEITETITPVTPAPPGPPGSTTTATFVYGISMVVTANGITQTVNVQGQQITTQQGHPPSGPTTAYQGTLIGLLTKLEGPKKAAKDSALIDAAVAANLNNASVLTSIADALLSLATAPPGTPLTLSPLLTTVNQSQISNASQN